MNDDKVSVCRLADTDTAILPVILPVVGPNDYGAIEDAFGVLEGNSVLSDVGFGSWRNPIRMPSSSEDNYKL